METYYRIYYSTQFDGSDEPIAFVVVTDGKKTEVAFPLETKESTIESYLEAIAARINALKESEDLEKPLAIEILDFIGYNMTVSHRMGEDEDEPFSNFEDAVNDAKYYLQDDLLNEEYPEFYDPTKEFKPVTAAVGECPPATQDIALNLKNRKNAIDTAMYGPLNPEEPNEEYWQALATEWNVDTETAKKQRCGNCAVFVVTTDMKNCISQGLTGENQSDEFDAIDAAGELGYCEAFDFKCASARTCRAWVAGGPVDDNKGKEQ